MEKQLSEEYFAGCMRAKQTLRFLPDPPADLQRRHIYILKTIYSLKEEFGMVRVSDIAEKIDVTLPSITKNIAELEEAGYVMKVTNTEDRRVVNIELTNKGLSLYKEAVLDFHEKNSRIFKDIPQEDIRTTIETIYRVYSLLEKEYLLD